MGERTARNKSEGAKTMFLHTTFLAAAVAPLSLVSGPAFAQWVVQESGTKSRMRGVSVVNERTIWASGSERAIVRTDDCGKSWRNVSLAASEGTDLDVRDIEAFGDDHAFALTIGPGEKSRIYETLDGGRSWRRSFTNPDADGFLDALAFWGPNRGLALGDPVAGRFTLLSTNDGGRTWDRVHAATMPEALPGEGAFAASGTCLVVGPEGKAWFGTGGAAKARVFRSDDWGKSWTAHETPVKAGAPSAGIFSLAFLNGKQGVAVGGDYLKPEAVGHNLAFTSDGGRTWEADRSNDGSDLSGFRSAVVFAPAPSPLSSRCRIITTGPNGTDLSEDHGASWKRVSDRGAHALGSSEGSVTWGVGEGGLIIRWERP